MTNAELRKRIQMELTRRRWSAYRLAKAARVPMRSLAEWLTSVDPDRPTNTTAMCRILTVLDMTILPMDRALDEIPHELVALRGRVAMLESEIQKGVKERSDLAEAAKRSAELANRADSLKDEWRFQWWRVVKKLQRDGVFEMGKRTRQFSSTPAIGPQLPPVSDEEMQQMIDYWTERIINRRGR